MILYVVEVVSQMLHKFPCFNHGLLYIYGPTYHKILFSPHHAGPVTPLGFP